MVKDIFFVPFAFDQSKKTGVNVTKRDTFNVYMKNLCVALISAKRATPEIDVALVCNRDVPASYKKILCENGVLIFVEPFDSFTFPSDYEWGLAFYKLCALEKMVGKYAYDRYLYTDADVFVQGSLRHIYEELKDHILLFDINFGLQNPDYRSMLQELRQFGVEKSITHYGGEVFGASRANASLFISECRKVYEEMLERSFRTTKGDEFIISIAASRMKEKIKNAGAYVFRFWTGYFYYVSTCYKNYEVPILHLPAEKNLSIPYIYDKYIAKNRFPAKKKVHRLCHLVRPRWKHRLAQILNAKKATAKKR